MVSAWLDLMSQADNILKGKLLIAFWRGEDGRGLNVRKVFLEPRTLDLVLWLQGPGAAPYLTIMPWEAVDHWHKRSRATNRSRAPAWKVSWNRSVSCIAL